MTDDEQLVKVERHDGWAELIINRPERRNAITAPVSEALAAGFEALASDDDVGCVILRGEGGYFCSGVDLRALQADPPPEWRDRQLPSWRGLHLTMFGFEKPVIGAFERFGINAGSALALACDLLIAGDTAFLQVGEIQQGAQIPMNAAWMRIKASEQVLSRMALYGDRVLGPDLVTMGLAAESVADDQVVDRCREIAARIAGFPQGSPANVKRSIIAQRGIDDPEAYFSSNPSPALLSAAMVK
ncbi:MAG: enoyl-CoA hydratase/isomerase family protein [Actinomycetota bacterium]|jgi:enoyl-CoA hydratase/carnithine racemase|nr:enoyl-CoA hydratase/isomerase family protein [Actinomycetota bacterium]